MGEAKRGISHEKKSFKESPKKIDDLSDIPRKAIDLWLEDQDLHLVEHKRHKLALLLVRYLGETGPITQERIMNLLGNLGGGHFDFDDLQSVEIEIQRLLGHTREAATEKEKAFFRKTAFMEVVLIGAVAFGTISIGITQYISMQAQEISDRASPAQMKELYRLIDEVRKLRSGAGMQTYSQEEALRILGSPIGIYEPQAMTQAQYTQITGILQNIKIELLKQQRPQKQK